jgi:hypothetical protein
MGRFAPHNSRLSRIWIAVYFITNLPRMRV